MKPVRLIAFDYETTSNKPQSTRGCQIAALEFTTDGEKLLLNEYTDPEVDIHHEAAEVHGITTEMTKGMRLDYIASRDLYDYIQAYYDEVILATHNGTTFDLPILERMALMAGRGGSAQLGLYHSLRNLPHIDTLVCATRLWPHAPNHKLSVSKLDQIKKGLAPGLIQHLNLGSGEGAHDALEDIRMVWMLVNYIMQKMPNGPWNLRQLAEWCATPRVLSIAHFGKHKGKPWGRDKGCVPYFYAKFLCDNFEDTTNDMVATMWHHYGLKFKCREN